MMDEEFSNDSNAVFLPLGSYDDDNNDLELDDNSKFDLQNDDMQMLDDEFNLPSKKDKFTVINDASLDLSKNKPQNSIHDHFNTEKNVKLPIIHNMLESPKAAGDKLSIRKTKGKPLNKPSGMFSNKIGRSNMFKSPKNDEIMDVSIPSDEEEIKNVDELSESTIIDNNKENSIDNVNGKKPMAMKSGVVVGVKQMMAKSRSINRDNLDIENVAPPNTPVIENNNPKSDNDGLLTSPANNYDFSFDIQHSTYNHKDLLEIIQRKYESIMSELEIMNDNIFKESTAALYKFKDNGSKLITAKAVDWNKKYISELDNQYQSNSIKRDTIHQLSNCTYSMLARSEQERAKLPDLSSKRLA